MTIPAPEQVSDRKQRYNQFLAGLTDKERESLQTAQGADGMLKAIFNLGSPEKIREGLSLAVASSPDSTGPEGGLPATPASAMPRRTLVKA